MCGIYGVLSYKGKLKDMNHLVDLLGKESAERGTDATGVAYVQSGRIKINKQPVSAYKFKSNIPKYTNAVIGPMITNCRRNTISRAGSRQIRMSQSNC